MGEAALVGAAFLYGSTFVAVQDGVEDLTPAAFLALRFGLAAGVLAPLALRRGRRPLLRAAWWPAGVLAGVALFGGYVLQTVGLQYTTTSSSAFVTGLYVVFTPLVALVALRRSPAPAVLAAVPLAVLGLLLLTGGGGGLGRGDAITLGGAVCFAIWLVVQDAHSRRLDPVAFVTVQVAIVAAGSAVAMLPAGVGRVTGRSLLAVAFTGALATSVAFLLQLAGQRRVGPTRAALLLLLEAVFAGLLGYGVGERLGPAGLVGAGLILVSILVAEVPAGRHAHGPDRSLTGQGQGATIGRPPSRRSEDALWPTPPSSRV
ncbi:MAG: DMT family transporter [Acidimicrobiia bacterium]|nr:DMT family transporter [Acidimicrobiia bacterium]